MLFLAVDLGSTNTKAGVFDEKMNCLAVLSRPVHYLRRDGLIEFDALSYVDDLLTLLRDLVSSQEFNADDITSITLTGQAESLVILGRDGQPLMHAISWMDERSVPECAELEMRFSKSMYYQHTGQMAVLPTWPATKIMWLRRNKPAVYDEAAHYVLLKDYVVYALCGQLYADRSIATFTFYYDIYQKQYWPEMLKACGISNMQLPELIEACEDLGPIKQAIAKQTGLPEQVRVNVGTLDHFAGMIGTGSVSNGTASLSMGTVMGLSTLAKTPVNPNSGIPMHAGFMKDTYVMLSASESGGACMEWFKRIAMPMDSYDDINSQFEQRVPGDVIFLPYILGANAPEFDKDVCGAFFGLREQHDRFDMAYAVMESMAHLLKKNCDFFSASGSPISKIISTGGGTKSPVMCQLQADVTGIPILVPEQGEAAIQGAAMIGGKAAGIFKDFNEAAAAAVQIKKSYLPNSNHALDKKHQQFEALYKAMKQIKMTK